MIGKLFAALGLTNDHGAATPQDESRLAFAALMVRLARADGHYDGREAAVIDAVLSDLHGLDAAGAAALRAEAEALETEAPDTVRFTRAIKDAVPYEERFGIVEALWRVALADEVRDHEEDGLMRLTANLLGVSDRDSGIARQRAAGRTG
jgi:uncharacterized tellurite resistance protein B-like protein